MAKFGKTSGDKATFVVGNLLCIRVCKFPWAASLWWNIRSYTSGKAGKLPHAKFVDLRVYERGMAIYEQTSLEQKKTKWSLGIAAIKYYAIFQANFNLLVA